MRVLFYLPKDDKEAYRDADLQRAEAMTAMNQKVGELRLIASSDIAEAAREIAKLFTPFTNEIYGTSEAPSVGPQINEMREKLFQAMRADLGEAD